MGLLNYVFGTPTELKPVPEGFDMMTVTFKRPDEIVVCYGREEEISIIRETIKECWKGLFIQFSCSYFYRFSLQCPRSFIKHTMLTPMLPALSDRGIKSLNFAILP